MDKLTFKQLIEKHLTDSLDSEELARLKLLLDEEENRKMLDSLMHEQLRASEISENDYPEMVSRIKQRMLSDILKERKEIQFVRPVHRVHFIKTAWFRYAAAIILILGTVGYIFTSQQIKNIPTENTKTDIQPGTDKATLILSDGKKIVLDDSVNENISDGSISIDKTNGVLTYNTASTSDASTMSYNTMSTPRGGQYQLVLPDGSRVWLNSASSLKYPTVFNGTQRIVVLNGEAYFDIKQNKAIPFIVKTQRAEVFVLGTEFNINSYEDESEFSTTLINGSVKVSIANDAKTIFPGQQANLSNSQPDVIKLKNDIDINQVIAWQKGIFEFKGATLDVIARQLSRWYDVEVRTSINNNNNFKFSGGITKKTPLKTLLKLLEINGVKNKWENNIITLYTNNMK